VSAANACFITPTPAMHASSTPATTAAVRSLLKSNILDTSQAS
jgi:hypothetical protein